MDEIAKDAPGDMSSVIADTNYGVAKPSSGKPTTVAEARVLEFDRPKPWGKIGFLATLELAESSGDGFSTLVKINLSQAEPNLNPKSKPDPKPAAPAAKAKPKADCKPAAPKAKSKSKQALKPPKAGRPMKIVEEVIVRAGGRSCVEAASTKHGLKMRSKKLGVGMLLSEFRVAPRMCTALCGFHAHPTLLLLLAMNRDEFLQREAQPSHFWPDASPELLAGRDVVSGGTWLGISRSGRFGFLTNSREGNSTPADDSSVVSRGGLVTNFLLGSETPEAYLQGLDCSQYNGFNLVVGSLGGDDSGMAYVNSRECSVQVLSPGVHGVSNGPMHSPHWPKVDAGKEALRTYLSSLPGISGVNPKDAVQRILSTRDECPDRDRLPQSPLGPEAESSLCPIFVEEMLLKGRPYGTRSQIVLAVQRDGHVIFYENYRGASGQWKEVAHDFHINLGGHPSTKNEL
eukprot:jgi/Tetstr1/458559/TSEL_044962.t1